MRGSRHQVAEMVGDHESHLAMGQDGGFRAPGRSGRKEEPAWAVAVHRRGRNGLAFMPAHERVVVLTEPGRADRDDEPQIRDGAAHGLRMLRKVAVADHGGCAARLCQIGHLARSLAKIRRHPNGAEPEAGEHGFEHLIAVLRLHQHTISLPDSLGRKSRRHGIDAPVEIGPCPRALAPDEACFRPMPPRRLAEEMGKVHDPRGCRCDAAMRGRGAADHLVRSGIKVR